MLVKCPRCNKPVEYSSSNKSRPFCGEKCRLIDFGDWIEEKNRIKDEASLSVETDEDYDRTRH